MKATRFRMGFYRSFEQERIFGRLFSVKNSAFSEMYIGDEGCREEAEIKSGDTLVYNGTMARGHDRELINTAKVNWDWDRNFGRHSADGNPAFFAGVFCCHGDGSGVDGEEGDHSLETRQGFFL